MVMGVSAAMAGRRAVVAILVAALVAEGVPSASAVVSKKPSAAANATPRPFEDLPEASTKELEPASDCSTPANLPGVCTKIQGCQPLFSLMQQRLNGVQIDFLRRSQCGFDGRSPKVCCPQKGRAPSQAGLIPDWTRVSGFTPVAPDGFPRENFPSDVPTTVPRSCGRQHVSTGLSRVVGGLAARNETVKARWLGSCSENPVPQHVGRLISYAPRRLCDPAPAKAL